MEPDVLAAIVRGECGHLVPVDRVVVEEPLDLRPPGTKNQLVSPPGQKTNLSAMGALHQLVC